jgi:GR25 family glycosyltransferase involved in LPS biosynthesis
MQPTENQTVNMLHKNVNSNTSTPFYQTFNSHPEIKLSYDDLRIDQINNNVLIITLLNANLFNPISPNLSNQINPTAHVIINNPRQIEIQKVDHTNLKLNESDRIIFVHDANPIDPHTIYLFELCYQLYGCDCIAINSDSNKPLIYDNYQHTINTNLPFSFKYKHIHDLPCDVVLSDYHRKKQLYCCAITIPDNQYNQSESEKYESYEPIYTIDHAILPRNLLKNVKNINYTDNPNLHVDFKHLDAETLIITTTQFTKNIPPDISFEINGTAHCVALPNQPNGSDRQTFFVKINNNTENTSTVPKISIVQTQQSNLSKEQFYIINTVLTSIPYLEYRLFDVNQMDRFITVNYNKMINFYHRINNTDYQSLFFKLLYVYKYGGLAIDINNLMIGNIIDIFRLQFIVHRFIVDYNNSQNQTIPQNNFVYSKHPKLKSIREYFQKLSCDLLNNMIGRPTKKIDKYTDDSTTIAFDIKYNHKNKCKFYHLNGKKIIRTTDDSVRKECLNILVKPFEITSELVKHLVWINLDRSVKRNINMINLLKSVKINNSRIRAICGNTFNMDLYKNNNNMSNYELACLFSHAKAITYLKKLEGCYFMVCEDDISLDNAILSNMSIDQIVKGVPKKYQDFEVLLLYKTYWHELTDDYVCWSDYYHDDDFIMGTCCYLITKKGVERFTDKLSVDQDNLITINDNQSIDVADRYIYKNLRTIVYRYNYISTMDSSSIIHPDHLDFHKKSSHFQLSQIVNNLCSLD